MRAEKGKLVKNQKSRLEAIVCVKNSQLNKDASVGSGRVFAIVAPLDGNAGQRCPRELHAATLPSPHSSTDENVRELPAGEHYTEGHGTAGMVQNEARNGGDGGQHIGMRNSQKTFRRSHCCRTLPTIYPVHIMELRILQCLSRDCTRGTAPQLDVQPARQLQRCGRGLRACRRRSLELDIRRQYDDAATVAEPSRCNTSVHRNRRYQNRFNTARSVAEKKKLRRGKRHVIYEGAVNDDDDDDGVTEQAMLKQQLERKCFDNSLKLECPIYTARKRTVIHTKSTQKLKHWAKQLKILENYTFDYMFVS
ncbi:unnamed protein product [Angiostrongylus costaricensis]|uniref:Uncharacterized protein n=1 Tax=Angiostrongylus costaricensis TaxID=334426 RepID=A0A158PJW4_ANGCS|nr:unnamed protein product [Angiostrongylus costaricensis]